MLSDLPLVFGAHPVLLCSWAVVLGAAVIADSAQFSAVLSEVIDPRYLGTALTAQVAIGFLITVLSIRLVPEVAAEVGWRWALMPLAAGPAIGVLTTRALL